MMKSEGWLDLWRSRPFRLALSLLTLTVSVLFTADLLGLREDGEEVVREARKTISEALAVQLSTLASNQDGPGIRYSVSSFVSRNRDVAAAALVDRSGNRLAAFGSLSELPAAGQRSTLRQMTVPILDRGEPWGEVQVAFAEREGPGAQIRYFLFVLAGCLLLYLLFLRKALDQLDPSRVVPGRVRSAFEMLSDGVAILDSEMKILLVNQALADSVGRPAADLVGQDLNQWSWEQSADWQPPWKTALATGLNVVNESLRLRMKDGDLRTYMVNATPVGDQDHGLRGVLVTLDDMTVIERKNRELSSTLRQLRRSQDAISRKNRELEALATRDPLTGLANRRALVDNFERQFAKARRENRELSCVMVDIDHFKQVNDSLGHAAGDEVICAVANKLVEVCREYDFVGRFGGEEFVVVLPDIGAEATGSIAERLRGAIEAMGQDPLVPVSQLSASFGTATLSPGVDSPMALLEQADQALYVAKERGRNRVESYDARIVKLKRSAGAATGPEPSDSQAQRLAELESIVDERTRDLERLRDYDSLTGVPKRELFLQRIEAELHRADRFGTKVGILSLEVKDLDRIVTSLGHASSESLLVNVVSRLQDCLRQTDLVSEVTREHSLSRVESNEFGVLLTDLKEVGDVMTVLGRLRRELTQPLMAGEQKVYAGINIGVAMFPESGRAPDELLKNAGVARIKAAGNAEKVSHRFASAKLDEASREYLQLEADLFEAVEQGNFEVHYQPIYDVERGCISAMEALLRWPHPQRGFVPPDVFISIAEDNGLINRISDFVLETAIGQLSEWHDRGWDQLRISVNVSPVQLRDPALAGRLVGAIGKRANLRPECLEVELTETSIMESPQRARVVLNQLREAGISVAMDDFGTGYSSLALLADLPLDSVKIDRSFVAAMDHSQRSRSIVESVINMAHALGLSVIGEGIETHAQFDMLSALGCQELQGYLLSKPLPAEDADAFLDDQSTLSRRAL